MRVGVVLPGRRACFAALCLFLCLLYVPLVSEAGDQKGKKETPPIKVDLKLIGEGLEIRIHLLETLPSGFVDTLPSGAVVSIVYPLKLRRHRWLVWDGSLWKGDLTARSAFDPITGRYRCELMLDEIIMSSEERKTAEEANNWLISPPSFRVVAQGLSNPEKVYLKVRAVFSTSTTLLVFPDSTGTDWISVSLGSAENGSAPVVDSSE